jgi:hypothetical protein
MVRNIFVCRSGFFAYLARFQTCWFDPAPVDVSGEELDASELLAAYQPDYFVSGHDNAFPYATGQSWNQKVNEMCLLVSGQLLSAPIPNHIKLNTESGEKSKLPNRLVLPKPEWIARSQQ